MRCPLDLPVAKLTLPGCLLSSLLPKAVLQAGVT